MRISLNSIMQIQIRLKQGPHSLRYCLYLFEASFCSNQVCFIMLRVNTTHFLCCSKIQENDGHVERSRGWIAEVHKLNVVAQKSPGRPWKTWDEVIMNEARYGFC